MMTRKMSEVFKADDRKWEAEAKMNKENNVHEAKKKKYKSFRDGNNSKEEYHSSKSAYQLPPSSNDVNSLKRNPSINNFASNVVTTRRTPIQTFSNLVISNMFVDGETPHHLV